MTCRKALRIGTIKGIHSLLCAVILHVFKVRLLLFHLLCMEFLFFIVNQKTLIIKIYLA